MLSKEENMRAEIKKLSESKDFLTWAETAELSQAQLDTHMKVCVYLESGSTKYVVDTYASWVYATTQLSITYNVIDRVDSENTIREYQSAATWLDTETRRTFLAKLEGIIIPRKRTIYNKFDVDEERKLALRKAHGSLILNLRTAPLGAAELG